MRVVLGYRTLANFAGSEVYLLTVADQLQRLGHEVWAYTHELGTVSAAAEERGVRVSDGEAGLPESCDAVLVQDDRTAYELAERYPDAPRIFVAHSTEVVSQLPPRLADVCPAVVALNDRVAGYVGALAGAPEVVRLRQPVDVVRFSRWSSERPEQRRVIAFGHDHGGLRWRELQAVCHDLGLDVELIGQRGRTTTRPEQELAAADVVIGLGRCVVEAMACGTAAYVNGVIGGDGWVTPESYARLEADGFSGRAFGEPVDGDRLRADLAAWTPELGRRGKELAWQHHDASAHASELMALWRRMGAADPAAEATHELARLARLNHQLEDRARALAHEGGDQRHRAEVLQGQLETLTSTRRWKLACTISAPLDRLRALASRGPFRRSGKRGAHD